MARQRIGMKKIRDVIRLKSSTTLSDRQIARALNISRPVVGKYWQGFLDSGLRFAGSGNSGLPEQGGKE